MHRLMYPVVPFIFLFNVTNLAVAQPGLNCTTLSTPAQVRAEGITERVGDIVLNCTDGTPGTAVTSNFLVAFNASITSRLAANSSNLTGVTLTVDNGSGPLTVNTPAILTSPNIVQLAGVGFTLSSSGSAILRLSGVRVAADQLMSAGNSLVQASLSISSLSVQNSELTVGTLFRGLYAGLSQTLICAQGGSPAAANPTSFASFLGSDVAFNTTRVTEGFAGAFATLNSFQGMGADTGTRIMIQYSGFPAGAQLFVPNVVAGSDAVQPTAAGDLGLTPSGGRYAPGNGGSLLLALVPYANASGVGGTPVYAPGAPGSPAVTFDTMSQVTLTNGAGFAVYEVVDSNPSDQENAQIPTFLSVPPSLNGTSTQTNESVSFAPVSTVTMATATDPIPRFEQIPAPPDCGVVGDCGDFPTLTLDQSSLQFTAQSGSQSQGQNVLIDNVGGGIMDWNATVQYSTGSGWIRLTPSSGTNSQRINIGVLPANLTPGTYTATVTVDAGPEGGAKTIAVTLVVTAAPPTPPSNPTPTPVIAPTITAAVNAATFAAGPLVPGSLATLTGTNLAGNTVTVTFDGIAAQILYDSPAQINLLVPASLAPKTSTQLVVTNGGNSSAPQTISLAPFSPGIFQNGILNQDSSVNSASNPAVPGSVIQIFATGLSGTGVITATIAGQSITQPYYAGPAPSLPGVQQVNLIVPALPLPSNGESTISVSVCGSTTPYLAVCSPAVQLAIAQ